MGGMVTATSSSTLTSTSSTSNTSNISTDVYIPVGCLVLPAEQSQQCLDLRLVDELSIAGWIRLEYVTTRFDDTLTTIRAFFLPDDVENARLDRSSPRLRKKRTELLASLDFSPTAWTAQGHGSRRCPRQPFPSLADGDGDAHGDAHGNAHRMSLLQMFNSIPSPNPDISTFANGDHVPYRFMSSLMAGTVHGLATELYPYQCRSAALMHQRESVPNQYLDPRLCKVLDQNRNPYYYDPVTGTIRREPRHYDAPRGGILAEEMGAGKTLICLALISATRHQPAYVPELYEDRGPTVRPRIASLMDMAAAVATKNSCPWPIYFGPVSDRHIPYDHCIQAIKRNPGWYHLPRPPPRRRSRVPQHQQSPHKIYLSHATLIVVPLNLIEQWLQEISKHTKDLKVHVVNVGTKNPTQLPPIDALIYYDILLCSVQTLEALWQDCGQPEHDDSWTLDCSLGRIRYKRLIVDEGHKLGNSGLTGARTNLLRGLNALHADARWIVTGTPSKGLYGTEGDAAETATLHDSVAKQERQDLERIGSIATFYLKARPWSNTIRDYGDTPADWRVYVMQPSRSAVSGGRRDCLRFTFNSFIIRHRLSEVSHLLPEVETNIVRLEGSYQDKLSLNLFSMMIIGNAVQSERKDRDYLFHPANRKSLLSLVNNLRQASFFGAQFLSTEEIQKVVETAEDFLGKGSVHVHVADHGLLSSAIALGKVASKNKIKHLANLFHEIPIYVQHFPGDAGSSWSIDSEDKVGLICTHSQKMIDAQKLLRPFLESPTDLNTYLNDGAFKKIGNRKQREELEEAETVSPTKSKKSANMALAGNTKLGEDRASNRKRRSITSAVGANEDSMPTPPYTPEESVKIAAQLANTQLVSTTSAKLSYLIDAIVKHQKDEQIIVFYEYNNTAWYLAQILEMLQIRHLIYAKGISSARRAQYISTFNHSTKFRVLFMDISQAAFGLDVRSASRIYFINPVHNPQVEAQAIGRVRRISQKRKVTVETLVLKNSLEEVIVERKKSMSQIEHRNCKTILDDRPIYEWILNPKIIPLPDIDINDGPNQMAHLAAPQYIFGREFGRDVSHPDEDIILNDPSITTSQGKRSTASDETLSEPGDPLVSVPWSKFRPMSTAQSLPHSVGSSSASSSAAPGARVQPIIKRARFTVADEAGEGSAATATLASESAEVSPARPTKRIRFADKVGDADGVDAT